MPRPTTAEAELIHEALGIRQKRHLSPEALAKATAALGLIRGRDKTASNGRAFVEIAGAVSAQGEAA